MSLARVAISLVILYLFGRLSRWYKERRRLVQAIEKLPGPPTIPYAPLIGHAIVTVYIDSINFKHDTFAILYSMFSSVNSLYAEEGIARFWLALKPVVLVFAPETVESVLTSTTVINKAAEYSVFEPWIGEGLVTSGRGKWRFRRKILTPAFHFRILNDFLPVMNNEATKLVRKINQKQFLCFKKPVDLVSIITLCTLDTICETAMGVNINSQDDDQSEYVLALHELGQMALSRVIRPWLWNEFLFYSTERGRRFLKARNIMRAFTQKVILERKNAWLEYHANDSAESEDTNASRKRSLTENEAMEVVRESSFFASGNKKLAFLDLLLHQHLNAKTMSLADVQEEVDTFMFAGHDTTAMGISWTLYMLSLHEDIQDRCREELDAIFHECDKFEHFKQNDDDDCLATKLVTTDITNEQISEMKYLDRVIKESLRLFPPIPFVAREVTEDMMIAKKYLVPRGSTCVVFTQCLHSNPRVFPKPEVFDPDRFLPENAPKDIFSYIPFSAGPRNCIGQKFAQKEQKVIIAKVIRNYHLKACYFRDKLSIVGELVLRSRSGLHVKFTPRFSNKQKSPHSPAKAS